MAKYIDSEKLKAEIERLGEIDYLDSYDQCVGFYNALDRIESFINSLQQEQPEVDLEKEIKNERSVLLDLFGPMNGEQSLAISNLARHFYELGKNSK